MVANGSVQKCASLGISRLPTLSEREKDPPLLHRRGRFRDFDLLNDATRGWDLDVRQLGRGPLRAEMFQLGVPSAFVTRVTLNQGFEQVGAAPPGIRTFGLIGRGVSGVRWCGQPLSDQAVTSFGRGGDYRAVSGPSFTCHGISLSKERIAEIGETLDDPRLGRLMAADGARVTACDPEVLEELRQALRRVGEASVDGAPGVAACGLSDELQSEIPSRLLRALVSSRGEVSPPSFGARDLAIRRAMPYIESQRDGLITIADLCRATRLSRRTLHYAFKEHFGVSPKIYLTAIRLDGVRRELGPRESQVKVIDVANRWGFWHMGQFAADYRRQFGELPSETLRRRGMGDAGTTG
jgi:AraC family ethanolamine operon transcriptional activator